MPKHKRGAILDKTLLSIAALSLLAGMIALGFPQILSTENRALVIILSSVGVVLCFVGMGSTRTFWRWSRRRIWRRAMAAWAESSRSGNAPKYGLACQLSEAGLRNLAIQSYSRMGYIIINRDGRG